MNKKIQVKTSTNTENFSEEAETNTYSDRPEEPVKKSTRNFFTKKKFLLACIPLIFLLVVGGYFGHRYWTSPEMRAQRLEKENKALITEIRKVMRLPEEANPVFYEIVDPAILIATQPFFTGSEKGDKLIVFPQSGKAVIYNPSKKIIINAGPIQFDQQPQQKQNVSAPVTTPTVKSEIKKKS